MSLCSAAPQPERFASGESALFASLPGYLYVGSAFGRGGLRARVGHHARRAVRFHWHVDYIRRYMRVGSVLFRCGIRCEYEWAAEIGAKPGASVVLLWFWEFRL
jgi:Uri superfamily endonuclease